MGYPSPESVSENVILSQGYTEFTQFDWNIKINEYQQNKTINFPKRIYINNTKTNVNIIIDKWQLKN
jgi:outer membrane biogenesis lipoprotein LolB